ncbi:hypothetical protein BD626DRAFT_548558 [Schizophyllum amplum]|uniref:Neutral protease 2 n=1 Tax=Schizophyllum amplum TaxID=97359 RepID=A0A550CD77_9AGAR|nr:hypothetical protein BD626DRAFT_548558 [Auriculariopsis ampla]
MFFKVSSLLALALAGSALATPVTRSDALKVELSGAESVTSIDDVKITAAITNTGAEAVKVLKYGTIFDAELPTRSFTVTKDDQDVAFTGIKMTVSIPDLDDSAFATIAAGETITVEHAVGSLFDFEAAGEGAYSFQPMTTFLVANGDDLSPAAEMLKTENSSSRTLSCVDTYGACTSGVIAYTLIATTNIYFCPIFFQEVPQSYLCTGQTTVASRNVRGGTVLHELTHAVGGTDDVTYGCSADQALSDANSYANADNYNCFSTQVFANQC